MVECCWAPAVGGVALRAVLRESAGNVIGIGRRCEVLFVAGITIGSCTGVVVIQVALNASQGRVHPGQRISGVCGVVEFGVLPIGGRMADSAVMRKIRTLMGRIVGSGPVLLMAGEAGRRGPFELIVDVARRALERGVHARQSISGHRQVIELGSEPVIDRVA